MVNDRHTVMNEASVNDGVVPPSDRIRRAGLRVTAARLAVLRVLEGEPHIGAESVATAVRTEIGTVSTQAIYDGLRALADVGLVRRFEPAGAPALYETRTGDNHHHLVCRNCGSVVDVDCLVGAAPCLDAADDAGFAIDEAEVTFWGTCTDCTAGDPVND